MGALDVLNNEIRTVAQTQTITVTNATNAVNATNATNATSATNASTADALRTARNIGGVSFDGTGNINLPGVNAAGNQNTSGTANNANNLSNIAATNYARKDSAAGRQDFANSIHVSGTHDVSGSTVGVSTTSNIGAFTGSP